MISKFTIKSILIKFFERYIYICSKKNSYFSLRYPVYYFGEDDLPNFSSFLTKLPEILNSLSLPVETIFRSAKLQSPVICFIIVLPLVLECDELSITYLLVFFSPTSRFFASFQTSRPFHPKIYHHVYSSFPPYYFCAFFYTIKSQTRY